MSTVSEINIYPVKGCQGISLHEASLDGASFKWDRMWAVADATTLKRLTQILAPKLASVRTQIMDGCLVLSAPMLDSIRIPSEGQSDGPTLQIVKSDGTTPATDEGDAAANWLTEALGVGPVRLVKTISLDARFSYNSSLLVISRASLSDLNSRLSIPIPMNRFRPNIVVDGCRPYEEDLWPTAQLGSLQLTHHKVCVRCAYTTMDQTTGDKDGAEPLATLAKYRRAPEGGVIFGSYFRHGGVGLVKVGDQLFSG